MIRRPAQCAGLRFERHPETGEGLDEHLLDSASHELASLPLLEFTLEELYKQRTDDNTLTFEACRRLGGVAGSLGRRAEEVFARLDNRVRAALPAVFRQLATIRGSEDTVPARRRVSLERLREHDETAAIVDAFVEARLFTTDRTDDGAPVVRVTHESLFTQWRALQEWLERDREFLRIRSRISTATERWLEENRGADLLLQAGKPLQEGMQLIEAGFELSTKEAAFIRASLRQARRQTALKRSAVAAMLLLTICALAGGLVANNQRLRADRANLKLRKTVDEKTRLAEEKKKLAEAEREARIKIEDNLKANRRFLSQLVGAVTSDISFTDPQFLHDLANTKTPLGLILFAGGMIETDPDQAAAALRQVIAYDPEISVAHEWLGRALARKGDLEPAISSFHRASRLEPDNATFQNDLGYYVYFEHGQYDKAAEEFRNAIEINPNYALAHANLGQTLAKLGTIEEAAAAYRRAIRLQPNNVFFQNNLGYNVYLEHQQYDRAAEEFRNAIEIDPNYALAHANLGQTLAKLGTIEEAAAAYRRAIQLQPNNVFFQNNLGYYVYLEHRQYDKAAEEFRRAIEIDPKYGTAYSNLGSSLLQLDRIKESIQACRRSTELEPRNDWFQKRLGDALMAGRDFGEAVHAYHKAVEIAPAYAPYYDNLGLALLILERDSEAADAFRQAAELAPQDARIQANFVEALLISGDARSALQQLSASEAVMQQGDFSLLRQYYQSVALRLLNENAADAENVLHQQLARAEHAKLRWDFTSIDKWIERAECTEEMKVRLRSLTEAMKVHFRSAHQSVPTQSAGQ